MEKSTLAIKPPHLGHHAVWYEHKHTCRQSGARLGVFLQVGFGGAFWLNILLTLLGYFPGVIHAVYIIAKR